MSSLFRRMTFMMRKWILNCQFSIISDGIVISIERWPIIISSWMISITSWHNCSYRFLLNLIRSYIRGKRWIGWLISYLLGRVEIIESNERGIVEFIWILIGCIFVFDIGWKVVAVNTIWLGGRRLVWLSLWQLIYIDICGMMNILRIVHMIDIWNSSAYLCVDLYRIINCVVSCAIDSIGYGNFFIHFW